ncbi:unnamed protein product, partial [Arabidopsis lyrata]
MNFHLPSAVGGVLTGATGVLAMSSKFDRDLEAKERKEGEKKKKKEIKEADKAHNHACWESLQKNKNIKTPKKTQAFNKAKREAEKAAGSETPAPV